MTITIIATLMLMLAYFLILYAGVGFIQNKKFFGSAPKEILDAVPDRKERFKGAHVIGWIILVFAFLLYPLAFGIGAWDGIRNGFGFGGFFIRFITMLYGMELFDIGFFDWVLLSHSNFFPRFYPEVKDVVGPYLFGYNWKTHLKHFLVYIPVCAALAGLCLLISGAK